MQFGHIPSLRCFANLGLSPHRGKCMTMERQCRTPLRFAAQGHGLPDVRMQGLAPDVFLRRRAGGKVARPRGIRERNPSGAQAVCESWWKSLLRGCTRIPAIGAVRQSWVHLVLLRVPLTYERKSRLIGETGKVEGYRSIAYCGSADSAMVPEGRTAPAWQRFGCRGGCGGDSAGNEQVDGLGR